MDTSAQKTYIGLIENGINIDHIPHGNAWYLMKILNLFNTNAQVGVGLNLPSKKHKVKDLIKIENRILNQTEIDAISLFCLGSTLSIIKNFVVTSKQIIQLPQEINHIIVCPNSQCISHQHQSKFIPLNLYKNLVRIKCYYCEQTFAVNEIQNYKF